MIPTIETNSSYDVSGESSNSHDYYVDIEIRTVRKRYMIIRIVAMMLMILIKIIIKRMLTIMLITGNINETKALILMIVISPIIINNNATVTN